MTRKAKPMTIVSQGTVDEQELELRVPLDAVQVQVQDAGPRTLAQNLYDATSKLLEAQRDVAKLQALYAPGTAQWHQCETIDDRLHDALALLGQ